MVAENNNLNKINKQTLFYTFYNYARTFYCIVFLYLLLPLFQVYSYYFCITFLFSDYYLILLSEYSYDKYN